MGALMLLVVAAISRPAWADITDSGNLTVGGQAVIAGTMAVQGSAFSVGGSTFQVAGGSVTLGGRLNAAAEGIKWADGTVQVSAPPSAGVLVSSGNVWNLIASTDTVAVTTVTFSGLSSSCTYRLEYVFFTTRTAQYYALFNDDTGANYGSGGISINASGTSYSGPGAGAYGINLDRNDSILLANSSVMGSMTFESAYKDVAGRIRAIVNTNDTGNGDVFSDVTAWIAAGSYAPGYSTLSKVHIVSSSSAGTARVNYIAPMTGHFELWRKGSCHP